jgi:hypothetical protein
LNIKQNYQNSIEKHKLLKTTIKPIVAAAQEVEKATVPVPITEAIQEIKKPKKVEKVKKIVIESDSEDEKAVAPDIAPVVEDLPMEENVESPEVIKIKKPREPKKPKLIEKGVAIIGEETTVKIGDTPIVRRLPRKEPIVNIKVSSYYMNNREKFINFINSLFEPYRIELEANSENISCDNIGNVSGDFSLLTHQKIVRDYMNLYTPYRGLLLYHGLGSGKSCTSIAIAEGMKSSKPIIIMLPASLQRNYREELKKCGDLIYKKNQYWEWISLDDNPDALPVLSSVLGLPQEYIRRKKGAWLVNITKKPNFSTLGPIDQKSVNDQLDIMINSKYQFINYNGLRIKRLEELTNNFSKNLFDNSLETLRLVTVSLCDFKPSAAIRWLITSTNLSEGTVSEALTAGIMFFLPNSV